MSSARVVRVAAAQARPGWLGEHRTRGKHLGGPVMDEETSRRRLRPGGEIARESLTLDVRGHYALPDLFTLESGPRARASA